MRERVVGILVTVLLMVPAVRGAERVTVEGILIRVNERIVTISDFTIRIRQELAQMQAPPRPRGLPCHRRRCGPTGLL